MQYYELFDLDLDMRNRMSQRSFWEQDIDQKPYDCLVVGAGIVGTNAAISLKQRNPTWRIALLEKDVKMAGASTRNAGFATFGSVSEILADYEAHGMDHTISLIKDRWLGLQKLVEIIGEKKLHLNWCGGREMFFEQDGKSEKCAAFIPVLNDAIHAELGLENVFEPMGWGSHFGMRRAFVIFNRYEGMLHPGMMMDALRTKAAGLGIKFIAPYKVKNWSTLPDELIELKSIDEATLRSKTIIIAANGYTHRLFPDLDIQPARNQVIMTEPIDGLELNGCFHAHEGYYYWRNVDKRVLIGGARHLDLTGETTDGFGTSEVIQDELLRYLKENVLPDMKFEIEYKWSGIMGVGKEKAPIVKKLIPNIFAAVRLGGMGVAIGTSVGQRVADMVSQLKNT